MEDLKEKRNIQFNYLYRDAGNYKSWGDIIFSNPDGLTVGEVESRLRKSFESDEFFIAEQINIKELFFEDNNDDDHCYHEFHSVESTDKRRTDALDRSIKAFIEQVETEAKKGWCVFERELQ